MLGSTISVAEPKLNLSYGKNVVHSLMNGSKSTAKGTVKGVVNVSVAIMLISVFSIIEQAKYESQDGETQMTAKKAFDTVVDSGGNAELLFSIIGSSAITGTSIWGYNKVSKIFNSDLQKNKESILKSFMKVGALNVVATFSWQLSYELFQMSSMQLEVDEQIYLQKLGSYLSKLSKDQLSEDEKEKFLIAYQKLVAGMASTLSNHELRNLLFYNAIRKGLNSDFLVFMATLTAGNVLGSAVPVIGNGVGSFAGLAAGIAYSCMPQKYKYRLEDKLIGGQLKFKDFASARQQLNFVASLKEIYRFATSSLSPLNLAKYPHKQGEIESRAANAFEKLQLQREKYVDTKITRIFYLNNMMAESKKSEELEKETVFEQIFSAVLDIRNVYLDRYENIDKAQAEVRESIYKNIERNGSIDQDQAQEIIANFDSFYMNQTTQLDAVISQFDYILSIMREDTYKTEVVNYFLQMYMTYFSENEFIKE